MSDSAPSRIRVYTHNIYARRAEWADRREALTAGVASIQPDIVLFQEEGWTSEYDQTADLLPDGWSVVHSAARSANEASGISVASRWPTELIEEVDLTAGGPPVDEFAWAALIVNVATPSGPIVVVNHFPDAAVDRENERERQALLVTRRVAATCSPDAPVILGGDLDAEPHGKPAIPHRPPVTRRRERLLPANVGCGASVRAVRHARSVSQSAHRRHAELAVSTDRSPLGANRPRRASLALQVETCDLVHDEPADGIWASDHYGLVVDLTPRSV